MVRKKLNLINSNSIKYNKKMFTIANRYQKKLIKFYRNE